MGARSDRTPHGREMASHAGWRAELLAQMALSRVPGLVVHHDMQDNAYDFVVATQNGTCFFVIVKSISSTAQGIEDPESVPALSYLIKVDVLRWASQSKSPVFLFVVDVDTDHARYIRLDTIPASTAKYGHRLVLPLSNTLDKDGMEMLLHEIGASEPGSPLVALGRQRTPSSKVLRELEALVKATSPREAEFVRFFERYPEMLQEGLGKGQEVLSRVPLESRDGPAMRPDFLIKPLPGDSWTIVELKSPQSKLLSSVKGRERASHSAVRALAQAREYQRYFESLENRDRFSRMYGTAGKRAKVVVIMGRSGADKPYESESLTEHYPGIDVLTYDQLLSRVKFRGAKGPTPR